MILALLLLIISTLNCAGAPSPGFTADVPRVERGTASYYHDGLHGNTTASGETYERNALSAAHRTLPLGTLVRVTNIANGKQIELRINDRGPFVDGRIIDVSRRAAEHLDFIREGIVEVIVEVIETATD